MTNSSLRILGVCGSLRRRSYNMALLRATGDALGDDIGFHVATIGDLPLYDRDVEVVGLPEPVQRFRTEVADADAVIFATPEYNWSISGALKNAIDWASRNPASPLDHKPAGIIGGGGRGGTARAQAHLREVLMHNRVGVLEDAEVLVPAVWDSFDDDLALIDDRVRADIEIFAGAFEDHVRRDISHRPALVIAGLEPELTDAALRILIGDYRPVVAGDAEQVAALATRWSPAAVIVPAGGDALRDAAAAAAPAAAVIPFAADDLDSLPQLVAAPLSRR